jgi:hypothetical protein
MTSLPGQSYAERRAALGYSHIVRISGRGLLHVEQAVMGAGLTMCGRSVAGWEERSALVWEKNPVRRCRSCEGPLGPKAVLKP